MTYDFSPLFRTAIGFDRMTHLLDSAMTGAETNGGYPPYNIEKTGENAYRITMAVAGFAADDLSIVTQENALVVAGRLMPPLAVVIPPSVRPDANCVLPTAPAAIWMLVSVPVTLAAATVSPVNPAPLPWMIPVR